LGAEEDLPIAQEDRPIEARDGIFPRLGLGGDLLRLLEAYRRDGEFLAARKTFRLLAGMLAVERDQRATLGQLNSMVTALAS
jgi:hypothetical protein